MKFKTAVAALFLSLFAGQVQAQTYVHSDVLPDLSDIECYNKVGSVTCSSDGYLSGHNGTLCSASVSYRSIENPRRNEIGVIQSAGYVETDTGFFNALTLGLSDAIVNQGSAIKARAEASKQINAQIKNIKSLVPRCNF